MRLINVHTHTLEEFLGDKVPPYAILSHRWEEEELTFLQLTRSKVYQAFDRTATKGYQKLKMVCLKTVAFRLDYVWIDTCCIDKGSSAELSEAINSMFRWYANASVCLAYLSDIVTPKALVSGVGGRPAAAHALVKAFRDSVWFTRAWTLQELIAPLTVHFYDSRWNHIGTKQSFSSEIQAVTKIPQDVLMHAKELSAYSVAEKMSWASGRSATRTEDIAYSLLGLFDVYMPLLYGEGEMAFIRLQEEIIRRSLDRSFMLWDNEMPTGSLLATDPRDFLKYGVQNGDVAHTWRVMSSSPFALTNAGLEIEVKLFWWDMNVYAAEVGIATRFGTNGQYNNWYVLLRFSGQGQYLRRIGVVNHSFPKIPKTRTQKITIQRDSWDQTWLAPDFCGFRIHNKSLPIEPYEDPYEKSDSATSWSTDLSSHLLQCTMDPRQLDSNAYMRCEVTSDFNIDIIVSFSFSFSPIICVHRGIKGLYFVHTPELIEEPDLQPQQGAKVALRSSKVSKNEGKKFWVCKLIDRQGVYVTVPELLCPPGWILAIYVDFFQGNASADGGAWHIAVIKREVAGSKNLLQTFQEDQFFADEAGDFTTQHRAG